MATVDDWDAFRSHPNATQGQAINHRESEVFVGLAALEFPLAEYRRIEERMVHTMREHMCDPGCVFKASCDSPEHGRVAELVCAIVPDRMWDDIEGMLGDDVKPTTTVVPSISSV